GVPYLDGGIADSVPVRQAEKDRYGRIFAVLTQPRGYRKKAPRPSRDRHRSPFSSLFYRRYPELVTALNTRNERYNETMDYIDKMESEGRIFVLRPEPQPGLSRLERNPERLNGLHRSGYRDMEENFQRLGEYLAGGSLCS
ncbi:MAG: hypothetical protein LBR47_07800, partial [Spirochaetaceae bacterium]|nr:hypothetical protein [Spirochaetaceae bacterium]